ncbi:MAG: helix-turn-helix domain-containing protein [Candidatus Pacearchaeota archaeon]
MLNKYFLINQIIKTLVSNKFSIFINRGCFDIAAKKNYKMLIKASFNLDGLTEEHALSLRSISYFVSAYPLIVSVKTNRDFLDDKIIYYRFRVPAVTPKMLDLLIKKEEIPFIEAKKGKSLVSVNCGILRERRREMGLSLSELSKLVGISKKALYEIENEKVRPSFETVKKIEMTLNIDLKQRFKLKIPEPGYLKPRNDFQRTISEEFERIGIENACVYSAPFEIVGKEEEALITRLIKDGEEGIRYSKNIKKLSYFLSSRAIFIAKNTKKENTNGVPIFSEDEIKNIENLEEFEKILKEKINIS